MLDYFFFIFFILSIAKFEIKGKDNFFYDNMELNNTNAIKGIFVWLIIFRHKTAYGNYEKYLFIKINNYSSSMIV